MNPIEQARDALKTALEDVDGIRVYMDPAPNVDAPAVVVSLPDLHFEAYCVEPTRATLEVVLVVKANSRAIDELGRLVTEVHEALESVDGATVETARIGSWEDRLPAYIFETEVALT